MTPKKDEIVAEVWISEAVFLAARARARASAQMLTAVCREVLLAQARQSEPRENPVGPSQRRLDGKRQRVRFKMKRAVHDAAKQRLFEADRSVTEAVEDGLLFYAKTGRFGNAPAKANAAR